MNDHIPADQRQLELATMRQPGSATGIEPGTVAARKVWLSVGAATEAAGRAGLNETALIANLQAELIVKQADTNPAVAEPFDWSWVAVGAAAVVLLTATLIGALSQRRRPPDVLPVPQIVRPARPGDPMPQDPTLDDPPEVSPAAEEEAIVGTVPASSSWDDLDEAINTTYTALQQLKHKQSGVDQSLTDFDTQLKQLSDEIAGESL